MKKLFFYLCVVMLAHSGTAQEIPAEPRRVQSPYGEALQLFQAGLYESTISKLGELETSSDREKAHVYNLKGACYYKLKDWDNAVKYFEAAIGTDPEQPHFRFNLGEVWFARQAYARAVPYYLRSREDNPQAEFKLLLCYLLDGKEENVEKVASELEASSQHPSFYYAQAAIKYMDGKFDEYTYFVTSAQAAYKPQLRAFYEKTLQELGWQLPQTIY